MGSAGVASITHESHTAIQYNFGAPALSCIHATDVSEQTLIRMHSQHTVRASCRSGGDNKYAIMRGWSVRRPHSALLSSRHSTTAVACRFQGSPLVTYTMEQLSTGDIHMGYPGLAPPLHIPTEVCENIIDMLYSKGFIDTTSEQLTALRSCALVCRNWRTRSQRMLFYRVQLSGTTPLRRLSTTLDAAQRLCDYVYEVQLTGYHLQSTTSIFSLFPAVFARKLPNLCRLEIVHLSENYEKWFPTGRTLDPPKSKSLPYIPLHSRFPAFLSSFTAVTFLYMQSTTVRSFSELARMLHSLPNLEELICSSVRWITPGGSHPGADFTTRPDWTAGRCTLPPFAPNLQRLWVRATAETIHCGIMLIVFSVLEHGHVWDGKADMDTWTPFDIVDSDDAFVVQSGKIRPWYVLYSPLRSVIEAEYHC